MKIPSFTSFPFLGMLIGSLVPLTWTSPAQAQRPNAYGGTMHWVGTWGASPSSPTNDSLVSSHAYKGTNQFTNQTVRLIVRTSIGGGAVRIRLSNVFGTQALTVGAAHIAVRDSGANIVAGTDRVLTFGHSPTVTIPNNADTLSDPVVLPVPALGDLAISLYLPGDQTVTTVHELASQTNYVSPANGGDHTGETTFTADPAAPATTEWQLLTGVEVYVPNATSAVATFGDSITDGFIGFVDVLDTNRRWPNVLAQRLLANGQQVGVLNQGISGGRVLNDEVGPNGESRFERDVLISGNVRWVIDLLGINDLGLDPAGDPVAIIAGKRQFIERAHAMGLKIYGCTLLPCSNSIFPHMGAVNNSKRLQINDFVRSGAYDAVIDFEAVMKDPANPGNLNPAYDSGDGLHPSATGYQAMGKAVDLSLFQ